MQRAQSRYFPNKPRMCRSFSAAFLLYVSATIILFGCRSKEHDFYFEEEWKSLPVDLMTAFSRDQDKKVYVQHRIRENAEDLWKLIAEKDACIFVAGLVIAVHNFYLYE